MKKASYVTFGDNYSGIYRSQVIDVLNYLSKEFEVSFRLVAFVSPRLWREQKRLIKSDFPNAKVFPIPGKMINWRRCIPLLKTVKYGENVIARGPIAFRLTEGVFSFRVYDGRGAIKAEVEECNVTGSEILDQLFIESERIAVAQANYRIAVSNALMKYWKDDLALEYGDTVVIPCTVSENKNQDSTLFENDHVRLVFAGGNGPWQSFYDVCNLLEDYLTKDITAEVLFLAQNNEQIKALKKKFPNRIKIDWVNPVEVQDLLKKCDYGLLLRKEIVTNQVASPVKFAEYLQAGLKVLISPGIGDFSFFVEDNQCGEVIKGLIPDLNPLTKAEREKSIQLCNKYFVKDSEQISKNYYALIQALQ